MFLDDPITADLLRKPNHGAPKIGTAPRVSIFFFFKPFHSWLTLLWKLHQAHQNTISRTTDRPCHKLLNTRLGTGGVGGETMLSN